MNGVFNSNKKFRVKSLGFSDASEDDGYLAEQDLMSTGSRITRIENHGFRGLAPYPRRGVLIRLRWGKFFMNGVFNSNKKFRVKSLGFSDASEDDGYLAEQDLMYTESRITRIENHGFRGLTPYPRRGVLISLLTKILL